MDGAIGTNHEHIISRHIGVTIQQHMCRSEQTENTHGQADGTNREHARSRNIRRTCGTDREHMRDNARTYARTYQEHAIERHWRRYGPCQAKRPVDWHNPTRHRSGAAVLLWPFYGLLLLFGFICLLILLCITINDGFRGQRAARFVV